MTISVNLTLLLLILSAAALAIPATAQSSPISLVQTLDSMNDTLASPVICASQAPFQPYVTPPYLRKCALAIRQLPSTETIGQFHQGGARDQYLLPVTKTSGSCQLYIETTNGGATTDSASWLAVRMAAVELTMACAPISEGDNLYGGTTLTGRLDGIRITIAATQKVGNATDTAATS